MPLLLPWLLCLANLLDGLYENPRNAKFVRRAKQELEKSGIVRVAVVGSYGKTSVKNILASLLSIRYKTIPTPESFNTPVGIAKTVTSPDFAGKEIFIAEMGARRKGDIAELCALVKPDYAVFTGVCAQHIETFGSEENILKAKCEILKGTAKKIVCGGELKEKIDGLSQVDAEGKEKCVYADYGALLSEVCPNAESTSFVLHLPDRKPIRAEVPLLGKHSAENVALAALLAAEIGLSEEEIERGIGKIQPVPHRLQLIESGGSQNSRRQLQFQPARRERSARCTQALFWTENRRDARTRRNGNFGRNAQRRTRSRTLRTRPYSPCRGYAGRSG